MTIFILDLWADLRKASSDLLDAFRRRDVALVLGWQDIGQRYRRSKVGAFWLTINMAILVTSLGFIFGTLFDSPMGDFLPFIGAGLIIWGFLATTLSEGCVSFIQADQMILHARLPLFTHVIRIWWRNSIILGHNLVIIPLILVFFGGFWGPEIALFPIAFALVSLTILPACLTLAVLCTRYRDIPQVVQNLLQILFYATPILWMPHTLPDRVGTAFLEYNPFYHLLSIMRGPLIGEVPSAKNWAVSVGLAMVCWLVALVFFGRFRHRIAYWL